MPKNTFTLVKAEKVLHQFNNERCTATKNKTDVLYVHPSSTVCNIYMKTFYETEMDSPEELEKKRICRIVTRDFPQYFAVVSRIKQESNHMGPDGGVLSCNNVPMVQASFPQGALTKRIRVGLQVQMSSFD